MTAKTQQSAEQLGYSRVELESTWWGNELFGNWVSSVWAVIDDASDDGLHCAVVWVGSDPHSHVNAYKESWVFDEWLPKDHVEIDKSAEWTTFEADDERRGTVYVALEQKTQYGMKVCLWGDTYEALSKDGEAALVDEWEKLHPDFNGERWTVDEVNGILITRLNAVGFDVKISEALAK